MEAHDPNLDDDVNLSTSCSCAAIGKWTRIRRCSGVWGGGKSGAALA